MILDVPITIIIFWFFDYFWLPPYGPPCAMILIRVVSTIGIWGIIRNVISRTVK